MEADFSKRYPLSTKTGRTSTPVEVIFRMLALKHLRCLSYENTIKNVKESLILKQFCRVYFNPLPNKSTLISWANTLSATTLEQINQRLTQIATQLQITQGRKIFRFKIRKKKPQSQYYECFLPRKVSCSIERVNARVTRAFLRNGWKKNFYLNFNQDRQ